MSYYLLGKLNCSFDDDVLIQKKMYLLRFLGVDLGYKFIWDDKQRVCSPELDDALDDLSLHRPQYKDEIMLDCGYGPLCAKVNNLYYVGIILLDDNLESVLSLILDSRLNNVKLYFCNSIEKSIDKLYEVKNENRIKDICISSELIYDCLNDLDFTIGYEYWNNYASADSLHPLDGEKIKDVAELFDCIEKVITEIKGDCILSDIETIILVDAWFQKNIQYIKGRQSEANGGYYICEEMDRMSNIKDPILNRFGRCEDISFTAALIFNHPKVGIKCRQVGAKDHSWNIITCDNKEYYLDIMHNITRNSNQLSDALMASAYTTKFTLLGISEAKEKYGITSEYSSDLISEESYSRNDINEVIESLKRRNLLETAWNISPVKNSYFVLK